MMYHRHVKDTDTLIVSCFNTSHVFGWYSIKGEYIYKSKKGIFNILLEMYRCPAKRINVLIIVIILYNKCITILVLGYLIKLNSTNKI